MLVLFCTWISLKMDVARLLIVAKSTLKLQSIALGSLLYMDSLKMDIARLLTCLLLRSLL